MKKILFSFILSLAVFSNADAKVYSTEMLMSDLPQKPFAKCIIETAMRVIQAASPQREILLLTPEFERFTLDSPQFAPISFATAIGGGQRLNTRIWIESTSNPWQRFSAMNQSGDDRKYTFFTTNEIAPHARLSQTDVSEVDQDLDISACL